MRTRVRIWLPVTLAVALIFLLLSPTCNAANLSDISGTLCLTQDGDHSRYFLAIDGIPQTLELVGTNLTSTPDGTRVRDNRVSPLSAVLTGGWNVGWWGDAGRGRRDR